MEFDNNSFGPFMDGPGGIGFWGSGPDLESRLGGTRIDVWGEEPDVNDGLQERYGPVGDCVEREEVGLGLDITIEQRNVLGGDYDEPSIQEELRKDYVPMDDYLEKEEERREQDILNGLFQTRIP